MSNDFSVLFLKQPARLQILKVGFFRWKIALSYQHLKYTPQLRCNLFTAQLYKQLPKVKCTKKLGQ